VCHGPAALLSAVKPGTSEPLVKGVTVTGFSNDEEKQVPLDADKALPYWLETKIKELGATYVKADEPWGAKVVWDQGILTGKHDTKRSGAQRSGEARRATCDWSGADVL
jgi:putative intracellular protease/amidase